MAAVDDLTTALRSALQAITDADVPNDLREAAFSKVLDHLLGTPDPAPREQQHVPVGGGAGNSQGHTAQDSGELGKIAAKLGVGTDVVERMFDVDDEGVHLVMPRKALAASKSVATQEVAYLVSAGRQALGLEDFTSSATIREVAEQRGVLDRSNFSTTMKDLDGFRARGQRAARELKINAAGYERAGEIVKRIAAGGEQ